MKEVIILVTFMLMSFIDLGNLANEKQTTKSFKDRETDTSRVSVKKPSTDLLFPPTRARSSNPGQIHLTPYPVLPAVGDSILRVQADTLIDVSVIVPPKAGRINLLWMSLPDSNVIYDRQIITKDGTFLLLVNLPPGEYLRKLTYTVGESTQVSISTKVVAEPLPIKGKFNKQ